MNMKVLTHSSTLALLTMGLVACGDGGGGGGEGIATGTINVSVIC